MLRNQKTTPNNNKIPNDGCFETKIGTIKYLGVKLHKTDISNQT